MKTIRLTENDLHRIIKKSVSRILKESEYTCDKLAQDQEDLAFKNGWRGSSIETIQVIEFDNGERHEIDDRYDDIEDVKKDLAKQGAKEDVNYVIKTKQVSRPWSV